jgi:hypothetical protein
MFEEVKQLLSWLFSSKPSQIKELEIVQMKHFPFSGFSAMSWCGRLVTRRDPNTISETTKTHETIHLKQAQVEGSWFKFYLKYLAYWIKGNPFISPCNSAYYTIPYEMEAYANEENKDYPTNYDGKNLAKYIAASSKTKFKECGSISNWKSYIKSL